MPIPGNPITLKGTRDCRPGILLVWKINGTAAQDQAIQKGAGVVGTDCTVGVA